MIITARATNAAAMAVEIVIIKKKEVKFMKKFFAMLLALAMVLSLAACGNDTDIRGEQINNNTQPPANAEADFSMGKVSGLTYENEFIGVGCKLDSAWIFRTDEEIREMNNLTMEMAGEDLQKALENANVIYDMHAVHSNGMDNIIVNLEKVNPLQLAGLDVDEVFESQMPLLKSSFENIGYTDIQFEIGETTIDGKAFSTLFVEAEIAGFHIYQATIALKCSGYLASISITTYNEQALNDLIDSFYLI